MKILNQNPSPLWNLRCLVKNLELRRSKRTNPSVYRRSGEQENPVTPYDCPINTKKKLVKGIFWN
jgi:hypothetical protein